MDSRKKLKELLTGPNPKRIILHLASDFDLTAAKSYEKLLEILERNEAGKAFVHLYNEEKAGERMNLHDYLSQTDKQYASG